VLINSLPKGARLTVSDDWVIFIFEGFWFARFKGLSMKFARFVCYAFAFVVCSLVWGINDAKALIVAATTTYGFNFVGDGDYVGYNVSGDITILNATDSLSAGGGGHDITNISGLLTTPALGLDGFISGPVFTNVFAPASPDNFLYLTAPYVDASGLAFQISNGSIFRIFDAGSDPMQTYDNVFGPGTGFILPDITGSFSVTAPVPEPSSWVMMILGFCGFAFFSYRRKERIVPRLA
jgi:hypothetical protein